MKTHDNLMIPILITDKDGIIIYKNRAAKRCIPSPRGKGNINKYLASGMSKYRIQKDALRIEFIRNSETAFNRALVFPFCDEEEMWCFIPELLISEPEELYRFVDRIDAKLLASLFNDISEEGSSNDKTLFVRYQRVYTELLSTMKSLNTESKAMCFSASDVLTSLKKRTAELASLYGLRMSFDIGIVALWDLYRLEFEAFASVYIQLLTLALRLTDTTGCAVTAFPSKGNLVLTVTSTLPKSAGFLPPVITDEVLCRLYPQQTSNILLLEMAAKLHGYDLNTSITDGRLALSLSVPLEKQVTVLHQEPARIIVQNKFDRLEKRFYEYMEAMFLQL